MERAKLDKLIFLKAYIAILLSFVTSRILLQTDLIMISHMGRDFTAAFSVPSRIMIIDAIFAFALGPVVSVAINKVKDKHVRDQAIKSSLSITLLISLVLMVVGLVFYPILSSLIVNNEKILSITKEPIFWMTVSIPIRMLVFIASMILFASDKGKEVSYIYIVTIVCNYLLNIFFIDYYGFKGVYISTLFVSLVELVWLLYLLVKLVGLFPFTTFPLKWIKDIFNKIGAEWVRLISWQGEGLVIIAILSFSIGSEYLFGIFGITSEFMALLMMPLIALMRALSMQIASRIESNNVYEAWLTISSVKKYVLIIALAISTLLFGMKNFIGIRLYSLSDLSLEIWNSFLIVFLICLPLYSYSYMQRACFQACERFSEITKFEMTITWLAAIPIILFAVEINNVILFFSAIIFKELIMLLILKIKINNIRTSYKELSAVD